MSRIPDSELQNAMRKAQGGDSKAYAQLLEKCSIILRRYIGSRLHREDEVEDVVQEILLSIHKARHTYDPERRFLPWMFALAHYRFNDHLRKSYREAERGHVELSEIEQYLAANVTETSDMAELLNKAMQKLPEKQRQIVHLMKVEGYTSKEVADKMEMGVSAVKVAAHRAYKQLKQEIEALDI